MAELPPEYHRLRRIVKSLIPRFKRKEGRKNFQLNDAKHMLNELGMQMSPELLEYLTQDDRKLDEFIEGIYALEDDLGIPVIDDFGAIRTDLLPKVYVEKENKLVGFSVTYAGEEVVFVEYPIS